MEIKSFCKDRLFKGYFKDKNGTVYNKRQRGIRTTAYIAKVAILSAMAYVLYTFARFPIFPPPYNVLELDFSAVPALLGGFALGPVATVIIEAIKVGIKMATQGSATSYVGDLSNLICSLAYVVPAAAFYRYVKKSRKNAIIGMLIGVVANAVLSSVSNYFVIIPFFAKFSPAILEFRVMFAFGFGLAFNLISTISNGAIVLLLYKRLSKVLHLGSNPKAESKKNKLMTKELKNGENITESAEETISLARRFGSKLTGGEVILLTGDLGAGKTTFTKGLAEALGVVDIIQSPTFTIIKEYQGAKLKLFHIDMYRIEDESELYELGLEDCFGDSRVTVIEWNKLDKIPSDKIIKMSIERLDDEKRSITIEGLKDK